MKSVVKYTRCKRCNRLLKSEEAKKRGYGSYCWHLHLAENKLPKNPLFEYKLK